MEAVLADRDDTQTPPTIISLADARSGGLAKYFTGKPCKNGHLSERHVTSSACIECCYHRTAAHRKQNPGRKRANDARYRANNRDKVKAKNTAFRVNNKDKMNAWVTAWQDRNPEKVRATHNAWQKANSESRAAKERNRRAKKKAAEGHHTKEDVRNIYEAQKGQCAYCQKQVGSTYHVDHIQPLAKGGSNWPDNLQITCPPCNLKKHARDPIEFMQSQGFLL